MGEPNTALWSQSLTAAVATAFLPWLAFAFTRRPSTQISTRMLPRPSTCAETYSVFPIWTLRV